MHKIITPLVSCILLNAQLSSGEIRNNLECENVILDQNFCMNKVIDIFGNFVDRELHKSEYISHLYVNYFATSPTFQDGQDSQVKAYLWIKHEKDGIENVNIITEVGEFLLLDGAQRVSAGIYEFNGRVFADNLGCLVDIKYTVDARDATIASRLPEPSIGFIQNSFETNVFEEQSCVSDAIEEGDKRIKI